MLFFFFNLLYNSLSLTLSFFLLMHYLPCLCYLASFVPPFLSSPSPFLLRSSFCNFVSVKKNFVPFYLSSPVYFLTLLSAFFSCLFSATLSCCKLPLSISLLLSSDFYAAVYYLLFSAFLMLLFFLHCFCSLLSFCFLL